MIPAIVTVAAVLFARVQLPVSEIVTTLDVVEPVVVPVHVPPKPLAKETLGDAGTVNDDGNVTLTTSPAERAPADEEVKPAVQVAVAPEFWGEPEKFTLETVVPAAPMTTFDDGWPIAVASSDV